MALFGIWENPYVNFMACGVKANLVGRKSQTEAPETPHYHFRTKQWIRHNAATVDIVEVPTTTKELQSVGVIVHIISLLSCLSWPSENLLDHNIQL